jgi:hypothetical protein
LSHFSNVTQIVFSLDEQTTKRFLGRDAKERQTDCPSHHGLKAECGLAKTGAANPNTTSTLAQPAIAKQAITILFRLESQDVRPRRLLWQIHRLHVRLPLAPTTAPSVRCQQRLVGIGEFPWRAWESG